MKNKANGNIRIAQELINKQDDKYGATVVHCLYFAVLQYMKHILATTKVRPISYSDQDKLTKGASSHDQIRSEIRNRISSQKEARDFYDGVKCLKQYRVQADYTKKQFTVDESLTCKQIADRMIYKLKNIFGDI